MKDIRLESFDNLYDAFYWAEMQAEELYASTKDDIKIEISLIDHSWRVGVITENRQLEIQFYDGFKE